MGLIRILDPQTANSIAAGEVVERPASVVKELTENALDAGATTITVSIRNGGILSISVTDNGCGLDPDDALNAFTRHATSKIWLIEDLDTIGTLGFRGEALASIAAVSKVTLKTRQPGDTVGTQVRIEGGELLSHGPTGCPEGTSILVEQLFYNTPARFKFLKKDSTETSAIAEIMERLILARPDVSFRLLANGQELVHSPGNNDLLSAIYAVYGKRQAATCVPITGESGPLTVSGYAAMPDGARHNRSGQTVLVNRRWIRSKTVTAAIDEAYKSRLMKGRFAFVVLKLDLPPALVDVNVHPQKLEVRFWKDGDVFSSVYQAIVAALNEHSGILAPEKSATEEHLEETSENVITQNMQLPNETPKPAYDDISATYGPNNNILSLHDKAADAPAEAVVRTDKSDYSPDKSDQSAPSYEQLTITSSSYADTVLKVADLTEARIIGTLFDTYVLLEWTDELLLIDQHAAHEKIIYERLRQARREKREQMIQPLLSPQTIAVTPAERIMIESEQPFFQSIGFDLEAFGNRSVILRTIPDLQSARIDPELALRTALQLLVKDRPSGPEEVDELLYQIACKAAVKAHDRLSMLEIQQLIADLIPLENPYTCPHGRPVIIRQSRLEIEKKFKRVL